MEYVTFVTSIAIYTTVAKEVLQEAEILKIVNHPHIARLTDILEDSEEEKLYLSNSFPI